MWWMVWNGGEPEWAGSRQFGVSMVSRLKWVRCDELDIHKGYGASRCTEEQDS